MISAISTMTLFISPCSIIMLPRQWFTWSPACTRTSQELYPLMSGRHIPFTCGSECTRVRIRIRKSYFNWGKPSSPLVCARIQHSYKHLCWQHHQVSCRTGIFQESSLLQDEPTARKWKIDNQLCNAEGFLTDSNNRCATIVMHDWLIIWYNSTTWSWSTSTSGRHFRCIIIIECWRMPCCALTYHWVNVLGNVDGTANMAGAKSGVACRPDNSGRATCELYTLLWARRKSCSRRRHQEEQTSTQCSWH